MADSKANTHSFLPQLLAVILVGLIMNIPALGAPVDPRDLQGITPTPSARVASTIGYTNLAYNHRILSQTNATSTATLLKAERDRLHTTVNAAGIPNDKQIENFVIRNQAALVQSSYTAAQLHALYLQWQAKGYTGDETNFDTFFHSSTASRQAFVDSVKAVGIYAMLSQQYKYLLIISIDLGNVGMIGRQPRIQLVNYPAHLLRVNKMSPQQCSTQDTIAGGAALIGLTLALIPAPSPANAVGVFLGLYAGMWQLMRPAFCP